MGIKHKNTFIFSKYLMLNVGIYEKVHLTSGKKREQTTLAAREAWWFCSVLSASLLSFAFFPAISCPVQSSSQKMSADQQMLNEKNLTISPLLSYFPLLASCKIFCVQYCLSIFRRVEKQPKFKVKDGLTRVSLMLQYWYLALLL